MPTASSASPPRGRPPIKSLRPALAGLAPSHRSNWGDGKQSTSCFLGMPGHSPGITGSASYPSHRSSSEQCSPLKSDAAFTSPSASSPFARGLRARHQGRRRKPTVPGCAASVAGAGTGTCPGRGAGTLRAHGRQSPPARADATQKHIPLTTHSRRHAISKRSWLSKALGVEYPNRWRPARLHAGIERCHLGVTLWIRLDTATATSPTSPDIAATIGNSDAQILFVAMSSPNMLGKAGRPV